jgi:hypothetical protein
LNFYLALERGHAGHSDLARLRADHRPAGRRLDPQAAGMAALVVHVGAVLYDLPRLQVVDLSGCQSHPRWFHLG